LQKYLAKFIPQGVAITNLFLTDWEHDPYTLGGFSYAKVGTTGKHFKNMKTVLKEGNNRIWFVGEYVDPV
jgi:monoamine oxidase